MKPPDVREGADVTSIVEQIPNTLDILKRISCGSVNPGNGAIGARTSSIRDPKQPDDMGKASLIAVIPSHLHKLINQSIFNELVGFGIDGHDISIARGFAEKK